MYNNIRPEVVDAKVYKLKSAFVKNSVFITLSYINDNLEVRPIEIFINSKDLTRAPEYVVLTRLVSAIFRRSNDPMFILEELQGIFDPNGGTFKDGKYYGQGTHTYSDGRKYVGAWKDDLPNGQGTWTHPDGSKYVGEWKKGLWHGQATFTYPDGKVVKGIFRVGELIEQQ